MEVWILQAHLRGRKHKRRADVVGVRVQRPSSHYCKICDITTTSAQHMVMHVAGKVWCFTTFSKENAPCLHLNPFPLYMHNLYIGHCLAFESAPVNFSHNASDGQIV